VTEDILGILLYSNKCSHGVCTVNSVDNAMELYRFASNWMGN